MKKIFSFLFFFLLALTFTNAYSQNYSATQTVFEGNRLTQKVALMEQQNFPKATEIVADNLDIIWQKSEPYAIGEHSYYSKTTGKSFINWSMNDQRVEQYENTNTAIWEFPTVDDFTRAYSNKNGSLYLVCDNTLLTALDPADGSVLWQKNFPYVVAYAEPYPDGTGFYCGIGGYENPNTFYSFLLTSQTPVWEFPLENHVVGIAVAEDHSQVAVAIASTPKLFIVDPIDGEVKQDLYYYNNSPSQSPAFSANGEYLVFADFSGYGKLYKRVGGIYELQWQTSITPAGAGFSWGQGQIISADGSTIAFGTFHDFNGAIYVYNTDSNVPLWTLNDCGSMVCYISMSDDGSIIACATWGPEDHSKPDLYIFNKESSEPIATLNTAGSLNYVNIDSDGLKGIAAGKAVHSFEMGWGGNAYFFNITEPANGNISGNVNLIGSDDNSSVLIKIEELPQLSTLTNQAGDFLFENVPVGTYSLTASKIGYISKTNDGIIVSEGNTTHITFELEPKTFIISATATEGGEIEPSGEITVTEGASQKFTIIPSQNNIILDLLVDGSSIGAVEEYTFENVDNNHTIHAVFDNVGVKELKNDISFIIIPNPANDYVEIQINNCGLEKINIEFYNVFGQLVNSVEINETGSSNTFSQKISIANLSDGVYFVKVGNIVQKLLKIR